MELRYFWSRVTYSLLEVLSSTRYFKCVLVCGISAIKLIIYRKKATKDDNVMDLFISVTSYCFGNPSVAELGSLLR